MESASYFLVSVREKERLKLADSMSIVGLPDAESIRRRLLLQVSQIGKANVRALKR